MKKRYLNLILPIVILAVLTLAAFSTPASAGKYGDGCPYDNWYNGTIHGGIYFQIKGHYDDAGATQNYTFENVPDGRKIVRFYPGIWLGSRGSMEYINWTITINGHTDSYSVKENASNDPWCNALDEPECKMDITGCGVCSLCYNASSYIVTGTNNISFWTSEQIYHAALLVIYENENMPEIQYWVKEGGQMYPGTGFSEYFNETVNTDRIYTGSIESVKFWSYGHPHCVGTCSKSGFPTLNGNDIGAPDYVYSYDSNGNIYEGSPPGKEYTVFGRWNNEPSDYLTRPGNLIYYPNLYDNRLMAPVLMLNYSEPSELTVTNISSSGLYADPDETGRYANVINATVVNNGGTAHLFNLTFYVNGTKVDIKRVTNLEEGESRVVSFLWAPNVTGSYVLNVTADVENIVKETDETNNSKTLDVEVTIAPPPAWQSQSSNETQIPAGGTIELRAQGKGEVGPDSAVLSTNETGTWENITDGRYGSPMDMASLYNHSITHTSESDWNNQTVENLTTDGEDVKLHQLIGTDNLAYLETAYAKSTYSTYTPAKAVDGDPLTFWRAPDNDFPNWWKVDLGEVKEIKKIYIDFYYRTVPCKYEVLISNDNETWTKKIEKSVGNDETYTGLDWSCHYINISIIESYYEGTSRAGINEFEAYGAGNYTPNGTLTSKTIETSNPIVAVIPTWNSTNSTNTSISVNLSVDNGATWKNAVNGEELAWDYNVHNNTKLKYKVLFEATDVNETPVLHDITMNYKTRDPIESEWLWSNFTWHNPSITNKTVSWKIYYKDMLGKTNCTDVKTFEVGAPDTTPPAQVIGVCVTTVSSSQLDVSWTANTEPDLDHYNAYRSETAGFTPGPSNLVALPTTNSYSDLGLTANTTYYYRVTAVDTTGNEGTPSDEASGTTSAEEVVEDKAKEDIPVKGDVTGSYLDTQASDNVRESIEEVLSGGKPANRYSLLEHKWPIDVTGDSDFVFYIEAHHSPSTDGDDFEFTYSKDDTSYTPMVTVTKTTDDDAYQSYTFTEPITGTVYIRVQDTDRTAGHQELNTVYIDCMYIKSKSGSPSYGVTVTIDEASQTVKPGESTTYTIRVKNTGGLDASYSVVMTGTAVDETTITVSPLNWNTGTLTPNAEDVQTVTVSTTSSTPETTYTLTATATCEQDASVTDSATSELVVSAATNTMHVTSIDMSLSDRTAGKNTFTHATAVVTIVDANGVAVEGATVSGHWSGATSDTDPGITDASGQVSLDSDEVKSAVSGTTFTFTVDDVVLTGWTYDSGANVKTSDSISVP